jgi:hypothetical protein
VDGILSGIKSTRIFLSSTAATTAAPTLTTTAAATSSALTTLSGKSLAAWGSAWGAATSAATATTAAACRGECDGVAVNLHVLKIDGHAGRAVDGCRHRSGHHATATLELERHGISRITSASRRCCIPFADEIRGSRIQNGANR